MIILKFLYIVELVQSTLLIPSTGIGVNLSDQSGFLPK